MNVAISHTDNIAVVSVSGHLDSGNAKDFEQPVVDTINSGIISVLFDFRECTFMSSAGIRVVLLCAKRLQQTEGMMVITGLNEYITQVFEMSGLQAILTIIAGYDDALAHLQSNALS